MKLLTFGTCHTEEIQEMIKFFEESKGKILHSISGRRWKNNIKVYLKEIY